ncbi:MAG TPA: protein kinase [Kofleriaceae bacterium]|nr:protein kinase [Kofleriaceae bacterium]
MSGATSNLDQLVQPGHVIAGKYRVERVLGKGGMGVVVAAHHLQLEQTVAIKLMLPEVMASPVLLQRFLREARAVAQLRSEHVCHVHDVGNLDDGTPYMVMEYLTGADLYQLMKERGGRLAIADAAEYVIQACAGMAEAHARGIVHRDLKPHNLFLTQRIDGSPLVKVLDFGVAKAADDFQATTVTSLLGSPAYMAPEQMRTAAAVDARADIYALGAILYAVLVGRMPFKAESLPELCVLVLSEPPEPPSRDRPDIPPALEAIILRCLAKSPDDRYQDVGALAQELAPFAGPRLSGSLTRMPTPLPGQVRAALPSAQVVHSTATGIVAPAPAPPPRRGRAGLVAGSLLVLAAAGGGIWWKLRATGSREKVAGPGAGEARPVPPAHADAAPPATGLGAPREVLPGVEGAVDLALSPDGEWIAYVSGGAIFVRELKGGTPERIELDRSTSVRTVTWFKGSKQLLAHAETEAGQALLAVERRGGRPTMQLAGARAGAVAPDGRQLAFATDGAIKVANADGSSARERVQLHDGESVPALTWEPHSERIAFLVARPGGVASIDVVSPDGSDRKTLAQGPFVARSGDALIAWSESGIAVVRHDEGTPRALVLLPVDRSGVAGDEQEILALGRKALRGLSVGNAGATLAYLMEAEQRDVMVARINGGQGIGSLDRVTDEERDDQLGAWTADGDALLIQSGALLLRHSLGSDPPREIAAGEGRKTDVVVAPDGRILFWRASGGKGEVVALPADGGTPAAVFSPEGTVWLRCVRAGCFAVERRDGALVIAPLDAATGRGDDIPIPRVSLSEGNAWDVDGDGNTLAAVGTDRIVRFVDLELGSVVASTPTLTWRVRSIAFDPAGQALFATGVDQAGEYVITRIGRDGTSDELQSSRSTRFAYLRVSPKGDRLAVQAEPVDQKLFLIDDPTRRSN